uniref:Uncharacterized protein n=1 Tax=uncultured bacterium contig00003 TaxID=1181495 RepID=A0A806KK52_9BACT|nr:hypothetical protein [uncultured bacterium contig00003]
MKINPNTSAIANIPVKNTFFFIEKPSFKTMIFMVVFSALKSSYVIYIAFIN